MPNDVNVDQVSVTLIDASNEKSTTRLNVRSLTDGATFATAFGNLQTEIDAITGGSLYEVNEFLTTRFTNVVPSDGDREQKWLVRYQDNSTLRVYSNEIPNADWSTVTRITGTDYVDLSVAPASDFVTAFEALVASPAGNQVTVLDIRFVGRNI